MHFSINLTNHFDMNHIAKIPINSNVAIHSFLKLRLIYYLLAMVILTTLPPSSFESNNLLPCVNSTI
jgi:hypothetical protein